MAAGKLRHGMAAASPPAPGSAMYPSPSLHSFISISLQYVPVSGTPISFIRSNPGGGEEGEVGGEIQREIHAHRPKVEDEQGKN